MLPESTVWIQTQDPDCIHLDRGLRSLSALFLVWIKKCAQQVSGKGKGKGKRGFV